MLDEIEILKKEIIAVHQLNQQARKLLEQFGIIWVKGELSGVKLHHSGHLYFTLKDQQAQINCAMFRTQQRQLLFTPQDGMEVIVKAAVTLYEQQGKYQLIVNEMEKSGLGQLQQAFEALKAKLQIEGLFESFHKKALPRFPRHIGIITSHTAAALQDILSVLKRRYAIAPITVYHTAVQGKGAAQKIAQTIAWANIHAQVDVLILARGGGSLEDLWSFNEEIVARAIFASQIPIITGIGHEIDFTIADFVADWRAPTPSAAAETISRDSKELIQLFVHHALQLKQAMTRLLQHFAQTVDMREKSLVHPKQRLLHAQLHCKHLHHKLIHAFRQTIHDSHHRFSFVLMQLKEHSLQKHIEQLKKTLVPLSLKHQHLMEQQLQLAQQKLATVSAHLQAVSPLTTLNRGYAIVEDEKQIIRDSRQLKVGQKVSTRLGQGSFIATVEKIISGS